MSCGINLVAQIGEEIDVFLVGAGEIENRKPDHVADIEEELLQPAALTHGRRSGSLRRCEGIASPGQTAGQRATGHPGETGSLSLRKMERSFSGSKEPLVQRGTNYRF